MSCLKTTPFRLYYSRTNLHLRRDLRERVPTNCGKS